MLLKNLIKNVKILNTPPGESQEQLKLWNSHQDSFPFLLNSRIEDVPIHLFSRGFIGFSEIVPIHDLNDDYIKKNLKWNFGPSSGYSYWISEGSISLAEPFAASDWGSMPVFFTRFFPGYGDKRNYIEINQRISHVLDIHWVENKKAWCSFNDLGETVPIANYYKEDNLTCCTLERDSLDLILFISNAVLVQYFEFSRSLVGSAPRVANIDVEQNDEANEIYARLRVYGEPHSHNCLSILRGFQIIRCNRSHDQMMSCIWGNEPRHYATFLIHDWKNSRVIEWSSNPEEIGNYFVESDLPYETSPAFFKPEVITQYRQDPERYVIDERTIQCRDAWSLRYDINEENQVHVYICDLSKLPYQEQLRWKAFNVEPRGFISVRAFKTDFEGSWDIPDDPLSSLKSLLNSFPQVDGSGKLCPVWRNRSLPETRNIDFLGYVITEARKEWEEQIMALAQVVVEGLNNKYINSLADTLGCRDASLASIKQLGKIMELRGIDGTDRLLVLEPLSEIWSYRSAGIAHSGNKRPDDLRQHYRTLIERTDIAMHKLAALISAGSLSM